MSEKVTKTDEPLVKVKVKSRHYFDFGGQIYPPGNEVLIPASEVDKYLIDVVPIASVEPKPNRMVKSSFVRDVE